MINELPVVEKPLLVLVLIRVCVKNDVRDLVIGKFVLRDGLTNSV
jgi:hypothetical protein